MSGFVLGPGEGAAFGFHGAVVVIKASGAQTQGQLAVMESTYPAGLSVREHVHAGEDEMFYLVAGQLSVFLDSQRRTVGPGSFVFIPRDRPHSFAVIGETPATALVITGPPRLDGQIAGRGEPAPTGLAG